MVCSPAPLRPNDDAVGVRLGFRLVVGGLLVPVPLLFPSPCLSPSFFLALSMPQVKSKTYTYAQDAKCCHREHAISVKTQVKTAGFENGMSTSWAQMGWEGGSGGGCR